MSTKGLIVAREKPFQQTKNVSTPMRVPMRRPGLGSRGQRIPLLTNHFQVGMNKSKDDFYHYSIAMQYDDGTPVDGKCVGRKVLDKVKEVYGKELAYKEFAYDGEKTLFTGGQLPHKRLEFMIVLDDISASTSGGSGRQEREGNRKRVKQFFRSKKIKVQFNLAAIIPMQAIANVLRGQNSGQFQEAVRVLDIILRQNAAKQGCLLVRQSFFHNSPRNFIEVGGGVLGCRGFHSSFQATQGGLSLNMDVSTTMILKPGPVVNFLMENQHVRDPYQIDWYKAKRMLKNLKIVTYASKKEYKITGLSDKPCRQQMFFLKAKRGDYGDGVEISVYEYYAQYKQMPLRDSANFPCINVGKPKKPTYFPLELCELVSLQRYTKSLSNVQRVSLVEKSRQKPPERMSTLRDGLRSSKYEEDMMLRSAGISISTELMPVEGRVLSAPKLRVGNGDVIFPRNGKWNFNNKTLVHPVKLERWAVVNFSARCDIPYLVDTMMRCADMKGISMDPPFDVFEENVQYRRQSAPVRVEKMFEYVKSKLPRPPQLLLCILPERKNSELYGPWKRKNLSDNGIATQCIAPTKVNDQYITNVLLKINAKLGGMNSLLTVEHVPSLPLVSKSPTMILGMDVSHGSPGQSYMPSIAAAVSSRHWPLISRYRAAVRTQSPKTEIIANLFNPVSDKVDKGIVNELLLDFYNTSNHRKPEQIIIFRDGVSESEFNQVLNLELDQIIKACKFIEESWSPKFMVIIAQKRHHTKFFQAGGSADNVPPGTIVDNKVCDPKNNDFYMCSHAGTLGTSRPTHYHVLYDELGFSADDLQELVHSLSYVYQRSSTAVSLVAPVCYAHLAAAQMSQFIKFDEMSETGSSRGGVTCAGPVPVQEIPRLHKNVVNSMFFC
ncbi:PREDICTED: protein argonaute 4A-like [Fragaria vesca subsp. vesca]|uniref:protein argonaute 4A-like n=1 Tax=Fragaria vesca subsp. vesca TaxID=101020 RepID=UPI0002C32C98|nr:PREDICTED: protein argonaute 4A-like [Fragaria vesca subsp. vesca]